MEDYVLDFIPDYIRHVQLDSGETDVTVIGYRFGGVLSLLCGWIFATARRRIWFASRRPSTLKLFQSFGDRRSFDVDRLVSTVGNAPPEMIFASFEMLGPATRAVSQIRLWGTSGMTNM
jgi:polyhydroxyalkanoate synthase